ncbi:MAG TPA: pseudouridine synthase [Ktedonobacterales bacterium]|nr:pseudouridine synthase [Ktedonobacterales bacterium]
MTPSDDARAATPDQPDDHQNDHPVDQSERLQKYLARSGVASRRHAEELIVAGAVTVNGRVVRELGVRVDPDHDAVRVRGERVRPAQRMVYLLLNKPAGVVTTVDDPEGRETVLDLLPPRWREQRVYPVGRLDQYTEGLLLLTNDGALALRLTHPRYALTKEYQALVRGRPDAASLERFASGLMLEGEKRPTASARAWLLGPGEDDPTTSWVAAELHEGRNRQVRRMFDALGHHALRLRRVRVGPLTLGDLRSGEVRPLTESELAELRKATAG